MKTGFRGTFVIAWSQTSIDGWDAAPLSELQVGSTWAWTGKPLRVDGPDTVLRLDQSSGAQDMRRRAAPMVERLTGLSVQTRLADLDDEEPPFEDKSFVVTDGRQTFRVIVVEPARLSERLLMFLDEIPPCGQDLWVVEQGYEASTPRDAGHGVICFTPGTQLATQRGAVAVEHLTEGDQVQTKDNGFQPVLWIGQRHLSGARLFMAQHMRPVRVHAGAFGVDQPQPAFLVSPDHRLVVKGRAALDLFNTREVLVRARDLVNGRTITRDHSVREVTYIHLMLPQHEIVFANGVETETFHPADMALMALDAGDRARLCGLLPGVGINPFDYGPHARRRLSDAEAAILMHAA